jgi:uncharacterized protein YndB with AHSA1/START domain
MRYADGPTAEATVHIAAPPETVWRLVSDIELIASLSGEVKAVEWVDADAEPPAVGCWFLGHNAHPSVGEWTTRNLVVACEPPSAFGWDTGEDPAAPAASWRFYLTPHAEGTELRQWARLGPGWSNLVRVIQAMPEKEERIVARRLADFQAGIDANLAAIKEMAETR